MKHDQPDTGIDRAHRRVILASSLGTMFEWYDFYLYGSLAAIIGKQFFSGVNETTAFIFALLAFAAGFAVRPFGAIISVASAISSGRKHTFLITIVIMGVATALVGLLPTYASIGVAAPVILITLRLLQGLAVGGEYGGAATYIAEHAPPGAAAYYTSWIQITATAGMILSLVVILGVSLTASTRSSRSGDGACRSCCRSSCCAFRCTSGCSSRSRRCFARCARKASCRRRRCANRSGAGAI